MGEMVPLEHDVVPITDTDPDEPDDDAGPAVAANPDTGTGSIIGSVTTSVYEHVFEHGRRYHVFRRDRYPLPNDEQERDREEMKHELFKLLLRDRLFLSPINPQKIIDLGTGAGHWAIDVGDGFPGASVTGVDLSPIQPHWVPPNVQFVVDDIEDRWLHGDNFDLIHLRAMSVVLRDPPKVIKEIYRHLKPGGWVEFQEINPKVASDDGSVTADHPIVKMYDMVEEIFHRKYGFNIYFPERLPAQLSEAGFVNVHRRIFHAPIGDWPANNRFETIGWMLRENMKDLVSAIAAKPFVEAGISPEEIKKHVADIRRAMYDDTIHAYLPVHIVWAQKLAD